VSGNCPGEVNPLIPDSPYKEEQKKVVQKWEKELNLSEYYLKPLPFA
jgi:hypothetical protein